MVDLAQAVRTQPAIKQPALKETPLTQWLLTLAALAFLVLFLFLPLLAVFVEALRQGVGAYLAAMVEPDALSAIKLTLLVAAIAVPLEPGVRRRRRLVHHQVRVPRQAAAAHPDRPAVLGLAGHLRPDLRAAVRRCTAGSARG